MQQDVTSLPARRFQAILRNWKAPEAMSSVVKQVTSWDGVLSADSAAAAIYEFWIAALPVSVFGRELGSRVDLRTTLEQLERKPDSNALASSLEVALAELEKRLGTRSAVLVLGTTASRHIPTPRPRCSRRRRVCAAR